MDEHLASSIARRASPYGLAVLPERDTYEYTDPCNEAAVEQHWRPICEDHGATVLGIRDVPTTPVRLTLDGIEWELAPFGTAERDVPAVVFNRWRALEGANVPFFYWLWGEEQPLRPKMRPLPETTEARPSSWTDRLAPLRDPIVVGVIPTAPGRGLWVLIGKWFH
ncbi:MAG: hypothetical protein OJF49_001060 [Ktedonobacterales bacterium]|jgi:hypothetical protein|nr:MAG: hypothetical protein OJF49_001060 [Ktedonobacterales bacterium]